MRAAVATYDHPHHAPQDAFYVNVGDGVFAAMDGLGGHDRSEEASAWTADRLGELEPDTRGWVLRTIEDDLRPGLRRLRLMERSQMTTTVVLAHVNRRGHCEIAWCGDSRAYRLAQDGGLTQITTDHDYLTSLILEGRIGKFRAEAIRRAIEDCQTSSDAYRAGGALGKRYFNRRHLMCSELSSGPIDAVEFQLDIGERLLLSSDGLHDAVSSHDIALLLAIPDLQQAADELRNTARDARAGVKEDDITVIVVER